MPNEPRASQAGLSLLGVLIGTFVLVGGTLALTQLMGRTERTVGVSVDRFVAANLAREGLELVQAYRDSNWFSGTATGTGPLAALSPWMKDICPDAGIHEFTIEHDGLGTSGIFVNHDGLPQLYRTPEGYWSHTEVADGQTPYQRQMRVDCSQYVAGDSGQGGASSVKITAFVRWTRTAGRENVVEVNEVLYDWHR